VDPQISVITLTHNKLAVTRRCLPSLLQTNHPAWELIVVDNGSTDGTAAWVEQFSCDAAACNLPVRLIRNETNIGCSTGRNQGADIARGRRLTFIDNDVALRSRNWLQGLSQRLDVDSVAMAGPKLVYPTPPHDIQCAGAAISPTGRPQFRGRGKPRTDERFNFEEDVQCLISACCMVTRSAFENANGFDEAFNPVEFEDFDLCYRIRSSGERVVYVPSVEMYHFESVTTAGTRALPNTSLIIRHGLLFKERWRGMFEHEDGPPDEDTRWKKLPPQSLDAAGDLPVID